VADSIDTRSAAGRLVLNVLASVAQWEREATGERTRDALAHLRREGVRLGGAALGWTRTEATDDKGRRVVSNVNTEIETMERMAALRAEGRTMRQIAATLTLEGWATKKGGRWHASTVRAVLERVAK
jgi:DNA invertase Pin-like site-specific DNA recombinase